MTIIGQMHLPSQMNQAGNPRALQIEEFAGLVEGALRTRSITEGIIPRVKVVGTGAYRKDALGTTTSGVVVPGQVPAASAIDRAKNVLHIEKQMFARTVITQLEDMQSLDYKARIAEEQGIDLAKKLDVANFIAAIQAARSTESSYSNGSAGKPAGHKGGTIAPIAAASITDPVALDVALGKMFTGMLEKDVDLANDGVILVVRPDVYTLLSQSEKVINGQYINSGNQPPRGLPLFHKYGVPVVYSNNLPKTNITGHNLSTATNQNFFDGDFTKVVAVAFSPRAILAGETIPLTSNMWYDNLTFAHYIDSTLAFSVTKDRNEFAGVIQAA